MGDRKPSLILRHITLLTIVVGGVSVVCSSSFAQSKNKTDSANQYLNDTYIKIESQKLNSSIDPKPLGNDVPLAKDPHRPRTQTKGILLDEENIHKARAKHYRTPSTPERANNPSEIIENRVLDSRSEAERQRRLELEREAYIEEFKARAARDGYRVEVDENLQVRAVKKSAPATSPSRSLQPTNPNVGSR